MKKMYHSKKKKNVDSTLMGELTIHNFDSVSKVRILTLVMMGGAQSAPPPIFICENNRKSNKIMHCVEIFFFDW